MARLRIRIELSRTGQGVPLEMLTGVVAETQKFLQLLAQDIRMESAEQTRHGEWIGFDFDRHNLHFTAEYLGSVTPAQVQAFNAAFDGATSLRRVTIAQFARISAGLGEDDAVGFGLFTASEAAEPSEWRCLSRRDALRITQGIDAILEAGADAAPEASSAAAQSSRLPAARDDSRHFGDRRDRGVHPIQWAEFVREVESTVTNRLARVEQRVDRHDGQLEELRERSDATEQSFRNLLSSIEAFCGQAASQIERVRAASSLPEPAAATPSTPEPPALPAAIASPPEPPVDAGRKLPRWWPVVPALGLVAAAIFYLSGPWLDSGPAPPSIASAAARQPAPEPTPVRQEPPPESTPAPQAAPTTPPAAALPTPVPAISQAPPNSSAPPQPLAETPGAPIRIEIEATEPSWITVLDAAGNSVINRLFSPGDRRLVEPGAGAVLRTGNAAGTHVRLNGEPIGEIGKEGEVRTVRFENGSFKIGVPER